MDQNRARCPHRAAARRATSTHTFSGRPVQLTPLISDWVAAARRDARTSDCGLAALLIALLALLTCYLPDGFFKLPISVHVMRNGVRDHSSPEFYDAMAVVQRLLMPSSRMASCMNYGWAGESSPAELAPTLAGHDERYCLQLYDAVVRAAIEQSFDASVQAHVSSAQGGLLQGLDVVEVGCGRGGGAAFVYAHHRPRSLVGIDASVEQIREACRRSGVKGLRFEVGRADALPLADACADMLINVESMHTYPDPLAFLRQVARVLRPGGIFVIADVLYPGHSMVMRPEYVAVAANLQPREHVGIHTGVARALALATFYPRLFTQIPEWVHALLGPAFESMIEEFSALPNSRRRRMFAEGQLKYQLGVYVRP